MRLRSRAFPLPKIVRAPLPHTVANMTTKWSMLQAVFHAIVWTIVERYFEQHGLHQNHQDGLEEERGTVVGAKPVEYPYIHISDG